MENRTPINLHETDALLPSRSSSSRESDLFDSKMQNHAPSSHDTATTEPAASIPHKKLAVSHPPAMEDGSLSMVHDSCNVRGSKGNESRPSSFGAAGDHADGRAEESKARKTHLLSRQRELQHRPLNCFRVMRGVTTLVVLLSTAFITLIFLAPLTFLLLRLYSVHYSRKATCYFFGRWLAMWPFLFEKVNQTKVVFAGDKVPEGERVIVLCNHRTEVDWMYVWSLALRKGRIGAIKYVLKSSVRNAPVFGWAFHILEFLLIERNWRVDEGVFESSLSTFKDPRDPLWLVLFPEGTDFTEEKCLRSQKYAEEQGLPMLSNVLLPRTKGFYACVAHLHDSLDAVYDLTLGYKYRYPLFLDNAFGTDPAEVHIHVRRICMSDIPSSEDEASKWLVEGFCRKDELLTAFYKEGKFPNSGIEGELNTQMGIFNFSLILLGNFLLLRFIFFSSLWIKVYIALSCVYFTAATYFDHKPTPILEWLGLRTCHR